MELEKILVSMVCHRSLFPATTLMFLPAHQVTTLDVSGSSSHFPSMPFPLCLLMVLKFRNTSHMLNGTLLFSKAQNPITSCTRFHRRRIEMGQICAVLFH